MAAADGVTAGESDEVVGIEVDACQDGEYVGHVEGRGGEAGEGSIACREAKAVPPAERDFIVRTT